MAQKLSREKVAFVVFILLIIAASVALAAYFLAARTLNVAANQVDDTLGMMNDYTVLVYPGTTPEPVAEGVTGDGVESASEEDEAVHAAETSAEGVEEAIDAQGSASTEPLSVAEVFRQYTLKGASVLSLDDLRPGVYATPKLYHVGHRRIGVVGVDAYRTSARLTPIIDDLRARGADMICLVTPRRAYVANPSLVNIVLVTDPDDGLTTAGSMEGSTFVVAAPQIGDVGVIAISSSNIISASLIEAA